MKVNEIIDILNDRLKLSSQESWDNSGLQIGDYNQEVKGLVLALDLSEAVIDYAIEEKVNLIITHHPFLFNEIKSINLSSWQGKLISRLIINNITVISLHTSLDAALNGITKELASKLGINEYTVLHQNYIDEVNNVFGYGGIGYIEMPFEELINKSNEKTTLRKYANIIKENLNCDAIKVFSNDINKYVYKVAFCGGSGADFIEDAVKKFADVYVTGDIKYHDAQYALNNNLSIIDAGHFNTENIILEKLYEILLPQVKNLKKYTKNIIKEHIF